MKLPWVSRALYEQTLADRDRALDRYYNLVERTALASAHHVPLVTNEPTPEQVAKFTLQDRPDPIREVIREQADGDGRLAAHLRRYARELKLQGLNDDQIVGKLVEWQTSEAAIP